MGVLEYNSYRKLYNPILLTTTSQMTRRESFTDIKFFTTGADLSNLGPQAPEASVLTTEVYHASNSY